MKTIAIIAGRGETPYNPGVSAYEREKAALTWELAELVQTELDKVPDVNPLLYTKNSAHEICKNSDYVLEIRFNETANDDDNYNAGSEIFVRPTETDIGVATEILKKLCALGFKNRGVKRRYDSSFMNAVKQNGAGRALLEVCFMDNANDRKLYLSVKEKAARAIAAGIAEGFGLFTPRSSQIAATKSEAKGNTAQEIFDELNPLYTSLPDIPDEWREQVAAMVECGAIRGDGTNDFAIRYDALQAALIAYRMMETFTPEIVYGFYNQCNPLYQSLAEVPDYWKEEVSAMMQSGAVRGDGRHELYIRHDALQAAVIAYRMMKNK